MSVSVKDNLCFLDQLRMPLLSLIKWANQANCEKKYCSSYSESRNAVAADYGASLDNVDQEALDEPFLGLVAANPLHAFLMIRRLTSDLVKIEEKLKEEAKGAILQ